jgi:hypothetical protein
MTPFGNPYCKKSSLSGDGSENTSHSPSMVYAAALSSRETLIKAFPAPDLRREAAHSFANPCASAGGSKEVLI